MYESDYKVRNVLRVALYVRKSRADIEQEKASAERGEEYDTLKRHRSELLRLAKKNEYQIVDIFEEVVSGDTIEARPEIQRLLGNVENYKYDAILVIDYDRFGRGNKKDQGTIEEILQKTDTLVITPNETIDLNSESGEFTADTKSFIARMEYRIIKRRFESGKRRSAEEGKNISSRVPFGFYKDSVTKKLAILEEEACTVRMIYKLSIEGYGTSAIATKLYNLGIKTRRGNDFTKKTVADIIKNIKYNGTQFYGATKNKSKSKNIIYVENAHEGIVSIEDWKLANAMLKQRQVPIPHNHKLRNPFAGILKCAFCNKTMKAVHDRTGIRLVCTTLGCTCRSSLLETIESKVVEAIYSILNSIDVEVKEEENNLIEDLYKQRDKFNNRLEELSIQRNSLHSLLERQVYTIEVFLERQEKVNIQVDDINNKINLINEEIEVELNKKNNIENLKPVMMNVMSIYFKSDPNQKNKLLKSFISKIQYNRGKYDNLIHDVKIDIFLK